MRTGVREVKRVTAQDVTDSLAHGFLGKLPPEVIEQLLTKGERAGFPAGNTLNREGDDLESRPGSAVHASAPGERVMGVGAGMCSSRQAHGRTTSSCARWKLRTPGAPSGAGSPTRAAK